MTDSDIYAVVHAIVSSVTGLAGDHIIPSDDNHAAPSGSYASIKIGAGRKQHGQANIVKTNTVLVPSPIGDVHDVNHAILAQLLVVVSIEFFRGNALQSAAKLFQANKLPTISEILYNAEIGWRGVGPINDLTSLQSKEQEERAQLTLTLMYESKQQVITNAIYSVNVVIENESGDTIQTEDVGRLPVELVKNLISCDSGSDTIYVHDGTSLTISSSFASPGINPFGLSYDGANIISCDSISDAIYIHDGITSTISSSFTSPGAAPTGLTYDGTNLISCDAGTDIIHIHVGVTSTVGSSFASPGTNPLGLTYDGTNLISCDADADTIYIHDGVTHTIVSSFESPGINPTGLAYDGTNLISCDSSSDAIYIHDGITSTIGSSFASPGASPTGLTIGN